MSTTKEVLKLDKSIDFNNEQPLNIEFIFSTNEVSKLDKNKEGNDEQFRKR